MQGKKMPWKKNSHKISSIPSTMNIISSSSGSSSGSGSKCIITGRIISRRLEVALILLS